MCFTLRHPEHHAAKVAAAQDILRSIINEEETDLEELRNWLDNIGGMESDKQIITTYIQEADYTSAQSLLDMIPSLYLLTGDELSEYNDYKSVKQLLMTLGQENRTIFDLTSAELNIITDIADNGEGAARITAQGILQYGYGNVSCNFPDLP